jgi:intergrase/recombinase
LEDFLINRHVYLIEEEREKFLKEKIKKREVISDIENKLKKQAERKKEFLNKLNRIVENYKEPEKTLSTIKFIDNILKS